MKFKLLFCGLLALFGLFAFTSCQADDQPTPDAVETILQADAPFVVAYDVAGEAKEWEFQTDGILKVYGQGRPSDGYVEVYRFERVDDSTFRLWLQGMEHPDGRYCPDAVPLPPYDVDVSQRAPDGSISAVLRPSIPGTVTTQLLFRQE